MLYYIIPPVIIVLSLAFLIYFLFRKFSAEGHTKAELLLNDLNGGSDKKEIGDMVCSFFSCFWLKLLENMMRKLKLFSLRIHNVSNDWFHSARNKREKMISAENVSESGFADSVAEENKTEISSDMKTEAIAGQRAINVFKRIPKMENFSMKRGIVRKNGINMKKEIPTATDFAEKNRLEDALIKRIAVNPKDIEAYERLGDYYSDMKNFKDAVECYRQVAKLSPRHLKAKSKLRALERILK